MALAYVGAASRPLQCRPATRLSCLSQHILGRQATFSPAQRISGAGRSSSSSSHVPAHGKPKAPILLTTLAAIATCSSSLRRRRSASRLACKRRFVACTAAATEDRARLAVDGDAVRIHYEGRLEDGTVFDSSKCRDPLTVILGKQQVIPGFESAIRGLKLGDSKTVTLPPDLAYGSHNPELVMTFDAAKAPGGLQIGDKVQLGGSGRQIQATVTEIAADGSVTVDANAPLAGKTLVFDIELVGFKEVVAQSAAPPGLALASFAAGCFWGVELAFQRVEGVISTNVGYAQGHLECPTYEDLCSATSGHTEAVRVVFDPSIVTFEKLLETFWERVGENATTKNRAGNDSGPQYRSGIYFHTEEQRALATASVVKLQDRLGKPVVTEVEAAAPFWLAEDYHQQYLEKGGRSGNPQSAEKGCDDTIRCYG